MGDVCVTRRHTSLGPLAGPWEHYRPQKMTLRGDPGTAASQRRKDRIYLLQLQLLSAVPLLHDHVITIKIPHDIEPEPSLPDNGAKNHGFSKNRTGPRQMPIKADQEGSQRSRTLQGADTSPSTANHPAAPLTSAFMDLQPRAPQDNRPREGVGIWCDANGLVLKQEPSEGILNTHALLHTKDITNTHIYSLQSFCFFHSLTPAISLSRLRNCLGKTYSFLPTGVKSDSLQRQKGCFPLDQGGT